MAGVVNWDMEWRGGDARPRFSPPWRRKIAGYKIQDQ
jgi:hypothetical protein